MLNFYRNSVTKFDYISEQLIFSVPSLLYSLAQIPYGPLILQLRLSELIHVKVISPMASIQ